MLRLLRNIVMAAADENQYQTLEPEVFNHPSSAAWADGERSKVFSESNASRTSWMNFANS